jgi:hypothetical protein
VEEVPWRIINGKIVYVPPERERRGAEKRRVEASGEPEEPVNPRALTREEKRILWSKARTIVDSALRETGLRYIGEMRIDGMSPETYPKFIVAIKERLSELLKEPKRLELRLHTYFKGYSDTDIYLDGEYIGTWRPIEPYVSAFKNWVHRVYNLLRELAERGLLKEEALRESSSESSSTEPASTAPKSTGPCGMGDDIKIV